MSANRLPQCALCVAPAVARTRELRPAISAWLRDPATPLCAMCEQKLSVGDPEARQRTAELEARQHAWQATHR